MRAAAGPAPDEPEPCRWVDDVVAVTDEAASTGAELLAAPVETPWRSSNSRLRAPAALEITFFQELEATDERAARPGFATDGDRP